MRPRNIIILPNTAHGLPASDAMAESIFSEPYFIFDFVYGICQTRAGGFLAYTVLGLVYEAFRSQAANLQELALFQ